MAKYQTIIKGVFADASKDNFKGWIGLNDGKIEYVCTSGKPSAHYSDELLEFDDSCLILPGFVDLHTHCREPGKEYKEGWRTLGLAAAHGGVTTIATMPNYGKGNSVINKERLEKVIELSKECIVDTRFWAGLCPDNLDSLEEMNHPLVVGYKGFTTDFDPELTFLRDNDNEFFDHLRHAIAQAGKTGKPSAWHCEDARLFDEGVKSSDVPWAYADWRTEESEFKMAKTLVGFASCLGARIHICHASTPQTYKAVKSYDKATTELTWHHTKFDKKAMREDERLRMNPPLRGSSAKCYMSGILDFGLAPIGTDHAPHTLDEKMSDNPPAGVPALDTYGSLLRNKIADDEMEPRSAAAVSSFLPAKLLGLNDRGKLEKGMRADFAVIRMDGNRRSMVIYSKCRWTPYDTRDYVEATIRGGKLIFNQGEPVV